MKRILSFLVAAGLFSATTAQADSTLLNVSYDPTRELYDHLGDAFSATYKADKVTIKTSNGGSGAPGRALVDGLQADGLALVFSARLDAVFKYAGLLPAHLAQPVPGNLTPS